MNDVKIIYNKPWILQRADPFICFDEKNDRYIFTASVPSYDRIVLRSARDIPDLPTAEEKVIWKKHNNGIMSENIWAPEIHYIWGNWYIYYAASDKKDIWHLRPYVLKCKGNNPVEDDWEELGQMQAADNDPFSFNAFSLDSTVFEINNSYYFVWAEKVGAEPQISNLYISKMESAIKLKTAQVLLSSPDYAWERGKFWVNEGPSVIKNNGKIYLTYSASDTGQSYCVGMLSANENDDLLDPSVWNKAKNPVMKTCAKKHIYGPGHNCFVKDRYGHDLCIYHARQTYHIEGNPLYNPNRHTMIMPIQWAQTGPIFSFED